MSNKSRANRTPLWSKKPRFAHFFKDKVTTASVNGAAPSKRKALSPSQPHSKTYGR